MLTHPPHTTTTASCIESGLKHRQLQSQNLEDGQVTDHSPPKWTEIQNPPKTALLPLPSSHMHATYNSSLKAIPTRQENRFFKTEKKEAKDRDRNRRLRLLLESEKLHSVPQCDRTTLATRAAPSAPMRLRQVPSRPVMGRGKKAHPKKDFVSEQKKKKIARFCFPALLSYLFLSSSLERLSHACVLASLSPGLHAVPRSSVTSPVRTRRVRADESASIPFARRRQSVAKQAPCHMVNIQSSSSLSLSPLAISSKERLWVMDGEWGKKGKSAYQEEKDAAS